MNGLMKVPCAACMGARKITFLSVKSLAKLLITDCAVPHAGGTSYKPRHAGL